MVEIALQICSAFAATHDARASSIATSSIMLLTNNQAKIIGFGLTKLIEGGTPQHTFHKPTALPTSTFDERTAGSGIPVRRIVSGRPLNRVSFNLASLAYIIM
ncbi:MAG: hypothetical protein ACREOI_08875 [bacterium]